MSDKYNIGHNIFNEGNEMDCVLYQETTVQRNDEVLEYVREIVDVIAHEIGETES